MMKNNKICLIVVLLFSFFFVTNSVDAGVCTNKTKASSGYCQFGNSYTYSYGTKFAATSSGGGWMGYPYVVGSGRSISGATEYGFCLDPGLKSPTDGVNYNWAREINITDTSSYDYKVYKTYQKYVNAIAYDRNTGSYSEANKNRYLGYTDVALRVYTIEAGYDIINDITEESRRFNQFKTVIYPYVHHNAALSGYDSSYWGAESHLADAKAYYQDLNRMGSLWNNPLKITPKVSFDTATGLYKFEFEIKLTNSTSKYFSDTTTGLANGDYDIGYGNAYLGYELKINDGAYALTNAVDATGASWITKDTPNANATKTAYLTMTEDIYNAILTNSGKVIVSLEYQTYHPMSSENVFLNFKNNRTNDADANYQRMVVFSKYVKKGKINSDGSDSEITHNYDVCQQTGSSFKYGDRRVDLTEYINKCGCAMVETSGLASSQLTTYSRSCLNTTTHEYGSTLNRCTTETSPGNNEVYHIYTKPVASGNGYCNLNCTESISIKSYTSTYSVKAGKYFELSSYPKLDSNKSCTVNVMYNNWKSDYEKLLNDEIRAVNKRLFDAAVRSATWAGTVSCSCGEDCTDYGDRWRYSYLEYSYNSRSKTITSRSRSGSFRTGSCGDTEPSTNSDSSNAYNIQTKIDKLEEHFEKIKKCNTTLNTSNPSDFYKFTGNLSFYYQQTYSKLGAKYNNEKPKGGTSHTAIEVDDSPFEITVKNDGGYTNGYKEDTSKNYTSNNFNTNNDAYIYIESSSSTDATSGYLYGGTNLESLVSGGKYSIYRTRYYSSSYSPSVFKYKEPLTGKISSDRTKINSPIELGKVYDTDVSAKIKNDNQNYYEFTSLGDNNEIYDAITSRTPIKFNGVENVNTSVENLKRYCTYEITNDVLCEDLEMCINYRMVDSREIDPNDRLSDIYKVEADGSTNGFKNWRNVKGETVYNDMKATDTFSPSNLEYSFTLDSKTISNIREYNKTASYDKINEGSLLTCNSVGNECNSKFVTDLESGVYGNTVDAKTDGRNNWKYLLYSSSRGWYIEGLRKDTISDTQYNNWINDPSSNYNSEGVTP